MLRQTSLPVYPRKVWFLVRISDYIAVLRHFRHWFRRKSRSTQVVWTPDTPASKGIPIGWDDFFKTSTRLGIQGWMSVGSQPREPLVGRDAQCAPIAILKRDGCSPVPRCGNCPGQGSRSSRFPVILPCGRGQLFTRRSGRTGVFFVDRAVSQRVDELRLAEHRLSCRAAKARLVQ